MMNHTVQQVRLACAMRVARALEHLSIPSSEGRQCVWPHPRAVTVWKLLSPLHNTFHCSCGSTANVASKMQANRQKWLHEDVRCVGLLTAHPERGRRGWSSCTRPYATAARRRTTASCPAARRRSSCAWSARRKLLLTTSSGNAATSGEDGRMHRHSQDTFASSASAAMTLQYSEHRLSSCKPTVALPRSTGDQGGPVLHGQCGATSGAAAALMGRVRCSAGPVLCYAVPCRAVLCRVESHPLMIVCLGTTANDEMTHICRLCSLRSVRQQAAGSRTRSLAPAAPTVSASRSRPTAPATPQSQSRLQSAAYSDRYEKSRARPHQLPGLLALALHLPCCH